jgi:peptidyl-prolyl cis-trans isomerase A (cyclophilin A)
MKPHAIACFAALALAPVLAPPAAAQAPSLSNPASLTETAPEVYYVRLDTSKGAVIIEVHRAWAPNGADRFYNLVRYGFYDDARFFRVLPGFVAQFGLSGDPKLNAAWGAARIPDDPVKEANRRGTITFAAAGPNTRTTQVFINIGSNTALDGQGFAPFGKVISGMKTVDMFYNKYGEAAPKGLGPDQNRVRTEGTAYLLTEFPALDYIRKATIIEKP